jgi:hypothetical protein
MIGAQSSHKGWRGEENCVRRVGAMGGGGAEGGG